MDCLPLVFSMAAWQGSNERCKNPNVDFVKGDTYLIRAGYNRTRQLELEQLWISNESKINELLGRDTQPAGRKAKMGYYYMCEDVAEILRREGYKYLNIIEACRDPQYRNLINLNYYKSNVTDKSLLTEAERNDYMQCKEQEDRELILQTGAFIGTVILFIFFMKFIVWILVKIKASDDIAILIIAVSVIFAFVAGIWLQLKVSSIIGDPIDGWKTAVFFYKKRFKTKDDLDYEAGDLYLIQRGYNRKRQEELENMWFLDTEQFERTLGRPVAKKSVMTLKCSIAEILKREGYKYLNKKESYRDPAYRKLIGMVHNKSRLSDKML